MPPGSRAIECPTAVSGAVVRDSGSVMPISERNAVKYPDHPTATVDAPKRYSRIRSQPMIQAMNSPRVA